MSGTKESISYLKAFSKWDCKTSNHKMYNKKNSTFCLFVCSNSSTFLQFLVLSDSVAILLAQHLCALSMFVCISRLQSTDWEKLFQQTERDSFYSTSGARQTWQEHHHQLLRRPVGYPQHILRLPNIILFSVFSRTSTFVTPATVS